MKPNFQIRPTNAVSSAKPKQPQQGMETAVTPPHCPQRWLSPAHTGYWRLFRHCSCHKSTLEKLRENNVCISDIPGASGHWKSCSSCCRPGRGRSEHAQRSQLWHLSENRALIVCCCNSTQWLRAQIKGWGAARSLCGHKYKQCSSTKMRGRPGLRFYAVFTLHCKDLQNNNPEFFKISVLSRVSFTF